MLFIVQFTLVEKVQNQSVAEGASHSNWNATDEVQQNSNIQTN